jgi:glycosyltransferase involved in cell wall biosynthesis
MNSQSFIRRELAEVEALGIEVHRYTLRRWDDTIVDPLDQAESRRTRVVLDAGAFGIFKAMLTAAITQPRAFWSTLGLALRLGRRAGSAGRGITRHLIYFAEACFLVGSFRQEGIDHVHAHFGTNSATVAALCRALGGPPFSFTVHGPEEFDAPLGLGLDEKVRRAAFVVAISEYGRSQVRRWVSYDHWPKIRVVRCGLDPMFLETDAGPPAAARRLVCVGRLVEQKGHLTLIEAAGQLHADGVDFELILVGDGPLRGEIERLIAAHGLGGRVRLTGWQSTAAIRDLIRSSRATVLSSFAEGLPVVIMESLALQRPVISTYVAGIPELVEPGVTGWLVPASSAETLADALRQALDAPVEELERMGAAGAVRVARQHRAATEAGKLVELFRGKVAADLPQHAEPRIRDGVPGATPR